MKELPEAPNISGAIEDIDKVVTVLGPALRHGRVVGDNQVADGSDVLMLPADQDDARTTECVGDQRLLLALRVVVTGVSLSASANGVTV